MLDYDTVRAARLASRSPTPSDWDQREKLIVDAARAEFAETRAREQHDAERAEFEAFCDRKADAADKAGNTDLGNLWCVAAETIKEGLWPISRCISADPEVMRFAGLRSTLNYRGANRRLDD